MKRAWWMILAASLYLSLGTSSCTSNYTVSYGYTGYDPYGDVFYQRPIDRYSGWGHP